jgi:hypothetical protein
MGLFRFAAASAILTGAAVYGAKLAQEKHLDEKLVKVFNYAKEEFTRADVVDDFTEDIEDIKEASDCDTCVADDKPNACEACESTPEA